MWGIVTSYEVRRIKKEKKRKIKDVTPGAQGPEEEYLHFSSYFDHSNCLCFSRLLLSCSLWGKMGNHPSEAFTIPRILARCCSFRDIDIATLTLFPGMFSHPGLITVPCGIISFSQEGYGLNSQIIIKNKTCFCSFTKFFKTYHALPYS